MIRAILLPFLTIAVLQDPAEYRRIFPLSTKNSWEFDGSARIRVTRKEKPKAGHEEEIFVVEFKTPTFTEIWHLQHSSVGLKEHKFRRQEKDSIVEIPADPPIMRIPYPPVAGRKWELRLRDAKDKLFVFSYEVLPPEDLEVPAGKLGTIPVKRTVSCDGKVQSEAWWWYAQDIGIARIRYADRVRNEDTTWSLCSFQIHAAPAQAKPVLDPQKVLNELRDALVETALDAGSDPLTRHVLLRTCFALCGEDEALRKEDEAARSGISAGGTPTDAVSKKIESMSARLGSKLLTVAKTEKDRLEWELRGRAILHLPTHLRGLRRLNDVRRSCGLGAVAWSQEIARGALLHARYLALTGYGGLKKAEDLHYEKPESAYYTPEGKRAGPNSVVSPTTLDRSIDQWIWSFYHRIPLLDPDLVEVGAGTWEEALDGLTPCILDVRSGVRRKSEGLRVILYPTPDAVGIEPKFSPFGELPKPAPGLDEKQMGQPITATFYPGMPRKVVAKLFAGGKEVDCVLHTPESPSNPQATGGMQTIALLPREALAERTQYRVRIQCELGGVSWEKEWRFTTR